METLLLKIPEVATYLGLSRTTVYELIGSGMLPAVKIGGCRRIRVADLRAFVGGLDGAP